jgi:DNA-binding transcriptional ArsR family regulator
VQEHQGSPVNLAEEWAPIFKVMGDPTRLRLLLAMHYRGPGEATVSELADTVGVRIPTASAALIHLTDAGTIQPHKVGREVRYSLTDPRIHALLHHLGGTHSHDHPAH